MDFDALRLQIRSAFEPLAGPCEFTEHERVRTTAFGRGTIVGIALTKHGKWIFRVRFDETPTLVFNDSRRGRNRDGTFPFPDEPRRNEADLLTGIMKLDVVSQLGDLLHGGA